MINVEIKARATREQQDAGIEWLHGFAMGPDGSSMTFKGEDRQTDTYFKVPVGRLKLREGNIENCLIQYDRPDQAGPKISKYKLVYFQKNAPIKAALTDSIGVLVVVAKKRQIYYLGNIKIHFDEVADLGYFIEIEARDEEESMGIDHLTEQTNQMIRVFGIQPEDLISESYSDMLLKGK